MEILTLLSGLFSVKGLLALAAAVLGVVAGWSRLSARSEKRKRKRAEKDLQDEKNLRVRAEIKAQVARFQQETVGKTAEVDKNQMKKEAEIAQEDDDSVGARLDSMYGRVRVRKPGGGSGAGNPGN